MKNLILFIILFSPLQSYTQAKQDTLFKKIDDTTYRIVFIAPPQSKYHKEAFNSPAFNTKTPDFHEHLDTLSSKGLISKRKFISPYSGEWISIHSYKGKSFAYHPSEPFYNLFIRITDTTIVINDFNEGMFPYAIKNVRREKGKIVFTVMDVYHKKHEIFFSGKKDNVTVNSSLFNKKDIRIANKHGVGFPKLRQI